MTSTATPLADQSNPTGRGIGANRIAVVVPWLLVLVLLASNGATVLSDRAQSVAFGFVAAMAGIVGEAASQAILARSPSHVRAKLVEQATRDLKVQNADLDARHRALQADHARVQASKVALAKEHEALRAMSSKRAEAVKNLTMRTTTKLASRSAEAVSTLPVRAVPYIGIAALVAFTTLEVNADCELARSLAELNVEHGNGPLDTGAICKFVGQVPSADQAWDKVKAQANTLVKGAYVVIESAASYSGIAASGPTK